MSGNVDDCVLNVHTSVHLSNNTILRTILWVWFANNSISWFDLEQRCLLDFKEATSIFTHVGIAVQSCLRGYFDVHVHRTYVYVETAICIHWCIWSKEMGAGFKQNKAGRRE